MLNKAKIIITDLIIPICFKALKKKLKESLFGVNNKVLLSDNF